MTLAPPDQLTDLEILEDYEFVPAVPCETTADWHGMFGSGDAIWLIGSTCPGCKLHEKIACCQGCWDAIMRCHFGITCVRCKHSGVPQQWMYIIGPIK